MRSVLLLGVLLVGLFGLIRLACEEEREWESYSSAHGCRAVAHRWRGGFMQYTGQSFVWIDLGTETTYACNGGQIVKR